MKGWNHLLPLSYMNSTVVQPHAPFAGDMVAKYDAVLGPVYFEPYSIETAERVAALHPLHVLETACGTGRATNHLRRKMSNTATLTATDVSEDMLQVAIKKSDASDLLQRGSLKFLQADAASLPFDDDAFDVVVCQFGLMFFSNKLKAFQEAQRVLKKNGTFIFSIWDELSRNPVAAIARNILKEFFAEDAPVNLNVAFSMSDLVEIKQLLADSGFVNVTIDTVQKPCIAESADELSRYTVEGSTTSELIRRKDPAAVPVLREKITAATVQQFGDHPVKGTMQAIYITAMKS